ncbi:MAG: HAMP domain-containing protein, partial [Zoogloea sp.]|nr:HAMP domain-containing protein [Zoogloea sp.]
MQRCVDIFNRAIPLQSLYAKILLGYSLVGLLFVVLAVSALVQFRGLQAQIADQQQVAAFFDTLRYVRRMEKSFLQYRRRSDIREATDKARNAAALLAELPPAPAADDSQRRAAEMLAHYRQQLDLLAAADRRIPLEPDALDALQTASADALQFGEQIDTRARAKLDEAVARHLRNLERSIFAAIALAVLTGLIVTRKVVRPLREIETSLARVATGETGRLTPSSDDREVESLTDAINRTLSEIEERQKHLVRSSRLVALGTMLSGVAHELNNPLSNISTSCQILLDEANEMPPDTRREWLSQIDDQVLRAQRIVSTLLDFARDRPFLRTSEQLPALVEEVLRLLSTQIPPETVITLDIPPGLGIKVDRQRFQQVLLNLVKNAVEAINGRGEVRITARREILPGGLATRVDITDDGPGISSTDLPRIFDPFYSTKPVGKGTGLGLFIVHEILTQHGGSITADTGP